VRPTASIYENAPSTTFAEQDKMRNAYDDAAFRGFGYHRS
jgi:hypothetical protein